MKTLTEQYILKSRTGVYQDTSENRRLHRVGQHYGEHKAEEGSEARPSKREQREARLAKYKGGVERLDAAIKSGKFSARQMEQAYELKTQLEAKISKLEAKLARGRKSADKTIVDTNKKVFSQNNTLTTKPKEETVEEAGKRVFESLSDADKKKVLDFYKEQSEDLLKDEGMTPSLVIGEVEEYRDSELEFSDDVEDFKEEFGLKNTSEAYGLARHALNLEIKRLEALEKEAEKKPEEGPELPDAADFKKMKEYYNKASNPERLAASIKDKDKLIKRYGAAVVLGWKEAQSAFARELRSRGIMDEEARLKYRNRLDKIEVDKSGMKAFSDIEKKVADSWVASSAYKMFNSLDGVTVEWKEAFKDAKTHGGKEAMSRNGRAWTEGFVVTLKGPGGEKDFTFDIITNEGGGLYGYATGYSGTISLKDLKREAERAAKQVATEKVEKVPGGHRIHYEDDLVEVYNDKGKEVYHGILDYCPYKDENYKWNEADQNYDLPQGYKMVGKTKH